MKRNKSEITRKVIMAQKSNTIHGDFYPQVKYNMELFDLSEADIILRTTDELKDIINKKMRQTAFNYLIKKTYKHNKSNSIIYENMKEYTEMKGSRYLFDTRFSTDISNIIFKFRTRMYNVKNNFSMQKR